MEEVAVDCNEGQGCAETAQAREFGGCVLQSNLDDKRREDILRSLIQFSLFSPSEGTGRIAFSHDLIAQALAARFFLKQLSVVLNSLGWFWLRPGVSRYCRGQVPEFFRSEECLSARRQDDRIKCIEAEHESYCRWNFAQFAPASANARRPCRSRTCAGDCSRESLTF